MVIFEPYSRVTYRGTIEVRARIQPKVPPPNGTEELVFEYPVRFADWVSHRADGFLAALVLQAMEAREPIEVRAPISARFANGLAAYQRTFAAWFPHRFVPVEIRAPVERAQREDAAATVTAFSGGVDSFYTLWSHGAENEPEEASRITHALFVHGFDLPLGWTAAYEQARALYAECMMGLGVDLIAASTNVQAFLPRTDWGLFHGGATIGAALVLDRAVRRFYMPASHTSGHLMPWGSDPRVDPLLSTEALEVVHDGAEVTRVHKTTVIGRWPPTFGRLRVCVSADPSVPNCCRCEKCVRTMTTLELFGLLAEHTSFPRPLRRSDLRACRYRNRSDLMFHREIFNAAIEQRRWDVAMDVAVAGTLNLPAMGRRVVSAKLRRLRAAVEGPLAVGPERTET
jgi:hypothetical protein